jgi:hypothetical protein
MIEVKRDVYNDLKILITDHQNVIKWVYCLNLKNIIVSDISVTSHKSCYSLKT